jgi:hypothetical protein
MSNIIKHGTFDIESALADLAEASKNSTDRWKPKAGQNVVRFLPPMEGKTSPFSVTYQHWITLPDGARRSMNCARMMAKGRCAACEKMDSLQKSGNAADFEASKDWKSKLNVTANIIDREDEAKGVQLYSFGKTVLDKLVAIRKDSRAGGDFTDSEDGFDIVLTKKGEGMKTEYDALASRNSTPLSDDPEQAALWLDGQYDLDRYKGIPSYEEQLELLGGNAAPPMRDVGRVNSAGHRKPEVLPPARTAGGKGRRIEDEFDVG